jgi:alkaline phosphatase D
VNAEACPERLDPQLTLLGSAQEKWLHDGLAAAGARWNLLAQQTLMAQVDRTTGEGRSFWTDGWDGYPKARERLLGLIEDRRIANPVVLSGDVHTFAVADLKTDFDRPGAPTVATEFCGGSLTSQGPSLKQTEAWRGENPHVLFANGVRHGYTTLEINAKRCTARLRVVDEKEINAPAHTLAAWTVESGKAGAQRGA